MLKRLRRSKDPQQSDSVSTQPPPRNGVDLSEQDESVRTTTIAVLGWVAERSVSDISMEFQMTIQAKVERLSTRQATMLMTVLNLQAVSHGVDVSLYLSLLYLRTLLVKSGTDPLSVTEENRRRALLISDLILTWLHGDWINLADRERLPEEVTTQIYNLGWFPNKRTIMSWKQYWDPRKFLQLRIVPLDLFLERNTNSEPYSGYCKGYGQDGFTARIQKTPFSAELDGEEAPNQEVEILHELGALQHVLLSLEKAKSLKRQERWEKL